jgi:hypothetical protein
MVQTLYLALLLQMVAELVAVATQIKLVLLGGLAEAVPEKQRMLEALEILQLPLLLKAIMVEVARIQGLLVAAVVEVLVFLEQMLHPLMGEMVFYLQYQAYLLLTQEVAVEAVLEEQVEMAVVETGLYIQQHLGPLLLEVMA